MSKREELMEELLAYALDQNDQEGNQLLHPSVVHTLVRAIVCNDDFVITLDQLAMWLAVKVGNLKRFLQHYTEGSDFRVSEVPTPMGRPKEIIALSIDCAKRLMLRTRSRRSEQIRGYFINMEAAHRDYMTHAIEKRLKTEDPEVTRAKRSRATDTENPFRRAPRGPGVYIMEQKSTLPGRDCPSRSSGTGDGTRKVVRSRVKVGKTVDLNTRYATHRRSLPGTLAVSHWEPTDNETYTEACVMHLLRKKAEGNEFFDVSPEEAKRAARMCTTNLSKLDQEFSEGSGSGGPY